MADKAPAKKAANTVPANPAAVVFPHSESGFTTVMRKEGLRAAGRIMTSAKKLDQFITELGILAQHAKARHEAALEAQANKQARLKAERERQAVQAAADAKAEVERLRAQAEEIAKSADDLEAKYGV